VQPLCHLRQRSSFEPLSRLFTTELRVMDLAWILFLLATTAAQNFAPD
jgi:hypothetical protein